MASPTPPPLTAPGVREVKLHRDDTSFSFGFALASQKNGDKIVVTVRNSLESAAHSTHTLSLRNYLLSCLCIHSQSEPQAPL